MLITPPSSVSWSSPHFPDLFAGRVISTTTAPVSGAAGGWVRKLTGRTATVRNHLVGKEAGKTYLVK